MTLLLFGLAQERLVPCDRYDIIFDMVGPEHYSLELLNPLLNRGGTFVTIVTPVLHNTDKHGLLAGLARTAYQAAQQTAYVSRSRQCSIL